MTVVALLEHSVEGPWDIDDSLGTLASNSWSNWSNSFSMPMKRAVQYCFFSIAGRISLTSLCVYTVRKSYNVSSRSIYIFFRNHKSISTSIHP